MWHHVRFGQRARAAGMCTRVQAMHARATWPLHPRRTVHVSMPERRWQVCASRLEARPLLAPLAPHHAVAHHNRRPAGCARSRRGPRLGGPNVCSVAGVHPIDGRLRTRRACMHVLRAWGGAHVEINVPGPPCRARPGTGGPLTCASSFGCRRARAGPGGRTHPGAGLCRAPACRCSCVQQRHVTAARQPSPLARGPKHAASCVGLCAGACA